MLIRSGILILSCVLLPSITALFPQRSEYRVEVRLVQLEVRVTKGGRPLPGLTLEDFRLWEDGKEQEIAAAWFVGATGDEAEPVVPRPAGPADRRDPLPAGIEDRRANVRSPAEPTWIYIAPEVEHGGEVRRVIEGLRGFLQRDLRPEYRISIGGLPFTDDRELLLQIADRMERSPYGRGAQAPPTVHPELLHMSDLEFQRKLAALLVEETEAMESLLTGMPGFDREPDFEGFLAQVPFISVETVDRQILHMGRLAMFRYLDLAERMARLPGKKIVVLFRSGFYMDIANYDLMQQLLSIAQRYRVSYYTIDSRGLDTIVPADDRRWGLPWHSGRRGPYLPRPLQQHQRMLDSRDGLVALAAETGGRSLLDTNDMADILKAVETDADGYYVIGYYPSELVETGRFRRIEVKVDARGLDVRAPKGYFERKPVSRQTRSERVLSLRQSLESESPGDFDLRGQLRVFADGEGQPLLIFSLGAPLGEMSPKSGGRHSDLEAAVLARVSDAISPKMPIYHEHQFRRRLDRSHWSESRGDRAAYLSYSSLVPVSPGLYRWQSAMRDENSGRLGTFEANILVPDLRRPSSPSSLLLTRQVLPLDSTSDSAQDFLAAGDFQFVPQPDPIFRQGEVVHVLYHLYNPTDADWEAASRGMQIGLLRDRQPVYDVQVTGQPFLDRMANRIRFAASIHSASLAPGEYTVLAVLPNAESRQTPHLEEAFTLLPTRGR